MRASLGATVSLPPCHLGVLGSNPRIRLSNCEGKATYISPPTPGGSQVH